MYGVTISSACVNTLRPRQNGRRFPDDNFKCILLNEKKIQISITISLKSVSKDLINIIPALVQIMAWRHPGDKPISELMMACLLTHICVTRPHWVRFLNIILLLRHKHESLASIRHTVRTINSNIGFELTVILCVVVVAWEAFVYSHSSLVLGYRNLLSLGRIVLNCKCEREFMGIHSILEVPRRIFSHGLCLGHETMVCTKCLARVL